MALSFITTRVNFPSTKGSIQSDEGTASFPSMVRVADASVKGFQIAYTNSDNEIKQLEIGINNITIVGTGVTFWVNLLLRDNSGNIDDPFQGWVDVLVTADVA